MYEPKYAVKAGTFVERYYTDYHAAQMWRALKNNGMSPVITFNGKIIKDSDGREFPR